MRRGDFAKADLKLPSWTDDLPGSALISGAELAESFGIRTHNLYLASDRGDFPKHMITPNLIRSEINRRIGADRLNKRLWRLSTVRAWLESRKGSKS